MRGGCILATLDDADTPLLLEAAVPIAREIFVGGPRRRHAAKARASHRAAGRRECRAVGKARAHCDCGHDNAGGYFPGHRQILSPRAGGAAVALRCAAPRYRPPRGSGALGDQPAGACRERHSHRLRRKNHPRRGRRLPPRPGRVSREPPARRTRDDRAGTFGARPRLPAGRDRWRRRPCHLGRRPCHDDDGPFGRPRSAGRKLYGQSARRARRNHDRAVENRPRAGRAAEYQGDRVPNRNRLAFARRA